MPPSPVSVVIPTYNRALLIRRALDPALIAVSVGTLTPHYLPLPARKSKGCYQTCDTSTQYGHEGPRFTEANTDKRTRPHLTRAKWLLCKEGSKEAREKLQPAGESPASYRMLAALPGFVAKGLLRMSRVVRG